MRIDEATYKRMPPHLQALFVKLPNPDSQEVAEAFAAFGETRPGHRPRTEMCKSAGRAMGKFAGRGETGEPENNGYGDTGTAARFFYCAKASRSERNAGVTGPEKPLLWSSGTKSPGTFQSPNTKRAARNNHPTVKPVALMRWLVRLVTPPGGLTLDPFAGSGSTLVAAVAECVRAVGVEESAEYAEIARQRACHARVDVTPAPQPGLFDDLDEGDAA